MDAGQGYCVYSAENGDCRTLVGSAFFELHEVPSDNFTVEVRSGRNLAMIFEDANNTVWQFDKYTGKFITAKRPPVRILCLRKTPRLRAGRTTMMCSKNLT